MGADETRSNTTPGYYPLPETPTGIVLISLLGIASGLFGFFAWLPTLGVASVRPVVTVGMMLLASAQVVSMVALVRLTPGAYAATLLVYAATGLVHASRANEVGVVVSLLVVAYVWSQRDLFEA